MASLGDNQIGARQGNHLVSDRDIGALVAESAGQSLGSCCFSGLLRTDASEKPDMLFAALLLLLGVCPGIHAMMLMCRDNGPMDVANTRVRITSDMIWPMPKKKNHDALAAILALP